MSESNDTTEPRELHPVTIPVHLEIRADGVVLNQPEMETLLRAAEQIAIGACGCRQEKGNCDAPLDVCLALDSEARTQIENNDWRPIAVEDALGVLEETYHAGLVHLAYRDGQGNIPLVCSCCSCCCGFLTSLSPRRYRDAVITSTFIAAHDAGTCSGCGVCVDRCTFGAFSRDPGSDAIRFDDQHCFGCGLCVGTCPSGAVAFIERI